MGRDMQWRNFLGQRVSSLARRQPVATADKMSMQFQALTHPIPVHFVFSSDKK